MKVFEVEPVSYFNAGVRCLCPGYGKEKLFSGYLKAKKICSICGLNLKHYQNGDGPASFVMFFIGIIILGLVIWAEVLHQFAYWIHLVLLLPILIIGIYSLLCPKKGILIALNYKHRNFEK